MSQKLLTIGQAADMIGVSIQTLRRWDESGRLSAVRRNNTGYRYYRPDAVENFIQENIKDIFKLAQKWGSEYPPQEPISFFYCQDISVFQARLSRLERELGQVKRLSQTYPLITAIAGEMGNNSFDHNLGNWPDIPGVFFAYDLKKGKVVLADRGRGILATLRKARPELKDHQGALKVAFTEVISGRAPEYRGNGLKFVREVVEENQIGLIFCTGDGLLEIPKNEAVLKIENSALFFQGCLALIKF